MYRPPSNNIEYSSNLCSAINNLATSYPNCTIWIAGDVNLPGICWKNNTVVNHRYSLRINNDFISCINDSGLEQMVNFPTRGDNILDIFLSNRPSLVNRIQCLPGFSDHDMVLIDSDVVAKRNKPVKREIRLWKKSNEEGIRQDLQSFSEQFINEWSIKTPIEDLWKSFKDKIIINH